MKQRIFFVDFEDSFTFNVISELKKINIIPIIVSVNEWKQEILKYPSKTLSILGPGPGHPDDYEMNEVIQKIIYDKDHTLFGLCLGHQLLAGAFNYAVKKCSKPVHGQSLEYSLPHDWQNYLHLPQKIKIQRYNSLAPIKDDTTKTHPLIESLWTFDNEIMSMRGERFLSYQFHPESIGTSYRSAFFKPLERFIL